MNRRKDKFRPEGFNKFDPKIKKFEHAIEVDEEMIEDCRKKGKRFYDLQVELLIKLRELQLLNQENAQAEFVEEEACINSKECTCKRSRETRLFGQICVMQNEIVGLMKDEGLYIQAILWNIEYFAWCY